MIRFIYIFFILFGLVAFDIAEIDLFTIPKGFPQPVYNFKNNTLTKDKVNIGRALFYDPILSKNNTISCASCHSQFSAFTHVDHALSHGIYDRIGKRNAPALINLAWQKTFMRDGAVNHLDVQSLAPIHNVDEMDETISSVVDKLQRSSIYPPLFQKAYGDTLVTGERVLKSLSQFMLTLVSSNAKYDSVSNHLAVFTEKEQKGYVIFKKHCSSCHTEPLFTNDDFYNNGLPIDTVLKDFGRYGVTKDDNDTLKFKVPTLRNIEYSYPYMHDGRFKKLSQVINHYVSGITHSSTLAQELRQPIPLTPNEKVDLISFLLTLSDKSFIFKPQYFYPKEILLK